MGGCVRHWSLGLHEAVTFVAYYWVFVEIVPDARRALNDVYKDCENS